MAADVSVVGCRKTYGDVVAVDDVDLEVGAGEFFTLLGPSGSGKTTTLRLIAGFELPDEGTVELGGREVSRVPPYARDANGQPVARSWCVPSQNGAPRWTSWPMWPGSRYTP